MNELIAAAIEVDGWLRQRGFPHYFIGGLAVQIWGEPRFTRGFDLCAVVTPENANQLMADLLATFAERFPGAGEMAATTWVLPLVTKSGIPFDAAFAFLPFEAQIAERAVEIEVAPGQTLPVCSAEDLAVYRSNADREKDAADLQGILARQGARLDIAAIRERLERLCSAIDDSGPMERFERTLQRWTKMQEDDAGA